MRIVFMGTPEFAVPSLRALLDGGYEVAAVVTQPDRPVGRKGKLTPPPVKVFAQSRGVPVLQFERIRRPEGRTALEALQPDLFVTAAFGQILSQKVLDIPRLGTINVHASLLPAYRGSAPINWCLVNGETRTGVTTMMTDIGIDTGDMLLRDEIDIGPEENAEALACRLAELGAGTLLRTLRALADGTLTRTPQDESAASYYPMLRKEMGRLDPALPARALHDRVRGLYPWPGAYLETAGGALKVLFSRAHDEDSGLAPGLVASADKARGLRIACGAGTLEILELQAPGGKRLPADAFLRGHPQTPGAPFAL